MLIIRLSRIGKKKKPIYRLIISERARDPYGRALEILGSYNPFTKELISKKDRIKYWVSKGAQLTPTVNNLLIEKGVLKGEKVVASKPGKKKEEEGKSNDNKSKDNKKTKDSTQEKPVVKAPEEKKDVAKEQKEEKPTEETKKE